MSFPWIVTTAALLCAFSLASFAKQRWATYTNPRFGTTADYPADLFTVADPPPENGDGQSFHTADGRAQLSIYGAWNVQGDTPKSYVANYVDLTGASVSYKRATDRFYVVSGTREGKIFYDRCNFPANPEGIIDCLSISYPEPERAKWSPIVSRLSGSLRAGNGIAQATGDEPEDYTGSFTTQALYTMCSEDNPLSREQCNLYLQGLLYGIQTERRMEEGGMRFCVPEMTADTARLRLLDFINGVTEGKPSNNKDDGNWIAFMSVSAGHLCKKTH